MAFLKLFYEVRVMKPFTAIFAAGLLGSNVATASSMSLTQFKPHVMPVLVQVDSQGHATKVLPSVELSPAMQRVLTDNIDGWIAGPAVLKGHAVDSSVIMNVALHTARRKDGKYDASFVYVSIMPSPFGGAAHWSLRDGDQLTLVSDSSGAGFRQRSYREPHPVRWTQPAWQPVVHPVYSNNATAKPVGHTR